MVKICPTCLYANTEDCVVCDRCNAELTHVPRCEGCGATRFEFAHFCYHCGLKFTPLDLAHSIGGNTTGENTTDLDASGVLDPDRDELLATTFYGQGVRLLHRSSSTFFDLPSLVCPFIIGKRSHTFKPDLDLRDFPQSEFISRSHAQLSCQPNQFYVEDLGSKNGTIINGVPLPAGQPQPLAFGDQLCFGSAEAFTFIFMKDQPINLEHLKTLSGQDRAFEIELLTSYMQSVTGLLDQLAQAIAQQAFAEVKPVASQVAIASYNVGADVMNLLAKQMEDQAQQKATAICEKTLTTLQDGLAQVHQFIKVFYDV